MKGDAEANWKLQIIKAEIGGVKPLINEVVDNCHVKERQVIEDFCFLLALYQLFKSVISTIVFTQQINGFILVSQNGSGSRSRTGGVHGLLLFLLGLGDARGIFRLHTWCRR